MRGVGGGGGVVAGKNLKKTRKDYRYRGEGGRGGGDERDVP